MEIEVDTELKDKAAAITFEANLADIEAAKAKPVITDDNIEMDVPF